MKKVLFAGAAATAVTANIAWAADVEINTISDMAGMGAVVASDVGVGNLETTEKIVVLDFDQNASMICASETMKGKGQSLMCKAYYEQLGKMFLGKKKYNHNKFGAISHGLELPDLVMDVPHICTLIIYGPDSPWVGVCGS